MPTPRRWQVVESSPPLRDRIAAALELDPIVAQVLVTRGYTTPEQARQFLDAPLEGLSDPDLIVDMPRAADRIATAVRGRERITVYGDYDADGVSATSLLLRGFAAVGADVAYYIPSRSREGYGLNDAALATIASRGGGVVIAVDCGVTAIEEAAAAASRGQDLVIVDHHEPPSELPRAVAVVDPKRTDWPSPFREYCAAGLAFQLLRSVRRRLDLPDAPEQLVDLAALGTIADIVPLVHDNRILARAGLARMSSAATVGLAALMRVIGLEGEVSARHVGFSLAPRINAAGRLGDAAVAVRLLTTDDRAEAETIAQALDAENERRQLVCDRIEAEAIEQVEVRHLADAPAIVLADASWHPGVIGIVASRLVERYYRPTVLIAIEGGVGKGSARSIQGFQLVDALASCASLLVRAGGHAMAAGLSIQENQIPEFTQRFIAVAGERLSPDQLVPTMAIDAEVPLSAITETLVRQLTQLAPFGAGNREPVLAARGLRPVSTRVLGDGLHLRLGLTDGHGYAEAIGFHLGDVSDLLAFTQAELDLAFSVSVDRWGDRERIQLVVRDLQTPGVDLDAVLADGRLLVDRLFARAKDYLANGAFGIEEAGAFYTKVVGVSFEGRQDLIRALSPGDALHLTREPDNPHDPHAIKIATEAGVQVGYLSARLAARLAPSFDTGARYSATISEVTGGGDRHLGINIYVQRHEATPEAPDEGELLRRAWQGLPGGALLERVRVHLHRGRPFRAPQQAALQAIVEGRAVHGIFGPGRERRAVIEVAAATAVLAGRGPVVIAVPLRGQVDRWHERLAPRLRSLGVRCLRAHGALLFRQRQRLVEALRHTEVDVLIASLEYLRQQGASVQPALLLVEAEPTIDGKTLAGLASRLKAPQVAFFEAAAELTIPGEGAGERHLERVLDPYLRTNLRLVDRREPPDRGKVLDEYLDQGDRVLVSVAAPGAAVEVASALRARPDRRVAYYHDGLPLRVRAVLEQMFNDGKIDMLVAAGFAEDAVPADLGHVVIAGLPGSRADLVEEMALAGRNGKAATVTLLYQRADLEASKADVAGRNPSREVLAALYRELRGVGGRGEGVHWPDEHLAASLQSVVPSRRTIGIGLDILAEAGVIQREFDGERWRITLPAEVGKRDLAASLRYAEGVHEAEAVRTLEGWAFGPLSEILRAVVGPTTGASQSGAART